MFSVVLAHFLTGEERMTGGRVAGVVLGLAGVAMLVGPEALSGLGRGGLGQFAVLAAALSYALAGAGAASRICRRWPRRLAR